jgi:xanthine dehydrogenase small subunit
MLAPTEPGTEETGVTRSAIRLWRQGRLVELLDFHPRTTLLDYLRLHERACGTKEGCAEGDCGACTVAMGRLGPDGTLRYEPVNSCIFLLGQADGADIVTVEDISAGGLHPVQEAMVAHHGSQCGFCTPGIVMSLFILYEESHGPVTRDMLNDALAGNLCRCTGYRPIVDAALDACSAEREQRFSSRRTQIATHMRGVSDHDDVFVGDETRFFAAPTTEDKLAALLKGHPDAILVAGSTDVGLWITKGLAEAPKVIWLGRVSALRSILNTGHGLYIGAGVSLAAASPALASIDADLGEVMRRFGSAQVRATGTVGGSIANGSPIGDLAPLLIALDSNVHLYNGTDERSLPLERFFITYGQQDRRPHEFVRGLAVPFLASEEVFRAYKISKRFDEDISSVLGAFKLTLDGRYVVSARIAYGGMAGTPKRAQFTEGALAGVSLDETSSWKTALAALAEDYAPLTDHRASAAYRMTIARNLLFKALSEVAMNQTRYTRLVGLREEAA